MTRVNIQLRSMPDVGYTTIYRVREGKRLTLALKAAQKRIAILKQATAVDEYGRSAYTIESEIEAQRVKLLVRLSKRKKAVSNLAAEVSALQQQISDYDRRIQLMTQKQSSYKNYFKRKPNSDSSQTENNSSQNEQSELGNESDEKKVILPPKPPNTTRSPRSRIPVSK